MLACGVHVYTFRWPRQQRLRSAAPTEVKLGNLAQGDFDYEAAAIGAACQVAHCRLAVGILAAGALCTVYE